MNFILKTSTFFAGFLFLCCACLYFQAGGASQNRTGPYDNERPAWGGNGGWWGDSHGDWYGDRDVPEEFPPERPHSTPMQPALYHHPHTQETAPPQDTPHGGYHPNTYYYNNEYPYGHAYEPNDPGLVDGAGLYVPLSK